MESNTLTPADVKQKLIDAGLVLAQKGQSDMTRGHLSARVPGEPSLFFMKAHSIGLDEITMDNILTIDLEGKVVAGNGRRHSEVFIHSEIYRARSNVEAVIHTHPTYTVALSGSTRPIRPLSQGGAVFDKSLPIYTDSIDLIRTQEMGRGVAAAMGPHSAVLLKNHGAVVTGRGLDEAVVLLVMLEEAAQIQLVAEAAGDTAAYFSDSQIADLRDKLMQPDQFSVNFNYLVRQAKRSLPK
jgi:L-ribulose-5-phosphate 4-epimerase